MDDSEGARWLPVEEAAKLLGITPDGIRKRVKRGQLEARRGNDSLIRVLVTSNTILDKSDTASDSLRQVSDGLRQERDAARSEAERWRQTAEERGQALARAEGELAAGQRTEAVLRELVDELKAQVARERSRRHEIEALARRPWWRKLLR